MTELTPPPSRFDTELVRLQQRLLEMAGLAEELLRTAMTSLRERDVQLTRQVRAGDDRVDALEVAIDEQIVELLALHHPVAGDLRFVFATLKASNDLERIGDHAVNIAKASYRLSGHPPLPDILEIWEMDDRVGAMLRRALSAMTNRDAEVAREVVAEDKTVDRLRRSAFKTIVGQMLAQPRHVSPGLEMILVVQNLERIGDLATNIAEDAVFLVEGTSIKHRPVEPPASGSQH